MTKFSKTCPKYGVLQMPQVCLPDAHANYRGQRRSFILTHRPITTDGSAHSTPKPRQRKATKPNTMTYCNSLQCDMKQSVRFTQGDKSSRLCYSRCNSVSFLRSSASISPTLMIPLQQKNRQVINVEKTTT